MGFSYDFIEFYTGYYLKQSKKVQKKLVDSLTEESLIEVNLFSEKCKTIHNRNQHKLKGVVNL